MAQISHTPHCIHCIGRVCKCTWTLGAPLRSLTLYPTCVIDNTVQVPGIASKSVLRNFATVVQTQPSGQPTGRQQTKQRAYKHTTYQQKGMQTRYKYKSPKTTAIPPCFVLISVSFSCQLLHSKGRSWVHAHRSGHLFHFILSIQQLDKGEGKFKSSSWALRSSHVANLHNPL